MTCRYCGREMVRDTETHPTQDHTIPRSKGGMDTVSCCYQCNIIKSDMMPDEWAEFMAANPRWWEARPVKPPNSNHICPVMIAVANSLVRERYKYLYK